MQVLQVRLVLELHSDLLPASQRDRPRREQGLLLALRAEPQAPASR